MANMTVAYTPLDNTQDVPPKDNVYLPIEGNTPEEIDAAIVANAPAGYSPLMAYQRGKDHTVVCWTRSRGWTPQGVALFPVPAMEG